MIKLAVIWDWVKNSALHQLLIAFFAILLSVVLLSQYPISFEFSSTEIQDHVQVTKDTQYVFRSEINKDGAKVLMKSNTYFNKISKS